MGKWVFVAASWAALCALAHADLAVKGPDRVKAGELVVLTAESDALAKQIVWKVETRDRKKVRYVRVQDQKAIAFAGPPGDYFVTATRYLLDKDSGAITPEEAEFTVTVGEPAPAPTPEPPAPTPKDDAPIKAPGNRVLIVYESADLQKLPSKQLNVIYSKSLREWLTQKCVTDQENPKGAWRIYDKDVDLSGEAKPWQDAMKRPRSQTPWLVISNGKSGFEGPLPATAEETLALLKKHLGE